MSSRGHPGSSLIILWSVLSWSWSLTWPDHVLTMILTLTQTWVGPRVGPWAWQKSIRLFELIVTEQNIRVVIRASNSDIFLVSDFACYSTVIPPNKKIGVFHLGNPSKQKKVWHLSGYFFMLCYSCLMDFLKMMTWRDMPEIVPEILRIQKCSVNCMSCVFPILHSIWETFAFKKR